MKRNTINTFNKIKQIGAHLVSIQALTLMYRYIFKEINCLFFNLFWVFSSKMLRFLLIVCIFYLISFNECNCQRSAANSNRINRMRGSVITNLTRTHSYDDDIVTSHLDSSIRIRQFYRMIRDVYNKYGNRSNSYCNIM